MPHLEDESLNIELFIQDFLVKRFLVHKFTPDLETKDPDYEQLLKISDPGLMGMLELGANLTPLPADRHYQVCYTKQ